MCEMVTGCLFVLKRGSAFFTGPAEAINTTRFNLAFANSFTTEMTLFDVDVFYVVILIGQHATFNECFLTQMPLLFARFVFKKQRQRGVVQSAEGVSDSEQKIGIQRAS